MSELFSADNDLRALLAHTQERAIRLDYRAGSNEEGDHDPLITAVLLLTQATILAALK